MSETIKNYATGDCITFLQADTETNGRISEFVMRLAPKSSWAKKPRHFHPYQTETFKVISGVLNMTIGKNHYVLTPNDEKKVIKKFTLHSFWNDSNNEVNFRAEILPPKNIEKGIRLIYKLSKQGKISKSNIPYNPMYSLILINYFDSYFAYIPWQIQKFTFRLGFKFARLFGYNI